MLKPKHTISKHVNKTSINAGELKTKSLLDKKFKLKLSNIYSKKLPKFNLGKRLKVTSTTKR